MLFLIEIYPNTTPTTTIPKTLTLKKIIIYIYI